LRQWVLFNKKYASIKAVPFKYTEEEAREVFDQFAKKSWFSPVAFRQPSGAIEKYFVPFWLFHFDVSVTVIGRLGKRMIKRSGRNAYQETMYYETVPIVFDMHFRNVPCYASTFFERDLVEKAARQGLEEFENDLQIYNVSSPYYKVDIYTIDSDSAWDITRFKKIEPFIRQNALYELKSRYPDYEQYFIEDIEVNFYKEVKSELIYYPLFVQTNPFLNVFWKGEELRSFLDGRNLSVDKIVGYRHIGFLRTFSISLISGCLLLPLIVDTETHNLLDYYPFIALTSIGIGLLAAYSPLLFKLYHNLERERINRYIYSAKTKREKQGEEYYWQYEDRYGAYGAEQSYYDYSQHRKSRRQQYKQQKQQQQEQQYGGGYSQRATGGFEAEVRQGKDFYTLLGLDPKKKNSYTDAEIQKAYRRAAMKYHPDMHPDPKKKKEMEEKFKEINQAYLVLQDSASRKKYNMYGRA